MGIEVQTGYWVSIDSEDSEKYIITLRGFRGEQDIHAVFNKKFNTLINTSNSFKIPVKGKIPESEAMKITLNGLFLSGLPVVEAALEEDPELECPLTTTLIDISSFLLEDIMPLKEKDILVVGLS